MKLLLWIFLLMLACPVWGQVVHAGELEASFHLEIQKGQPLLVASLRNLTGADIPFYIPAGVRFNGLKEPCLPVVLGQDVQVNVPPHGKVKVATVALSLSFFPHTPGNYEICLPDRDSRLMCSQVQKVWTQAHRSALRASPIRLSQLVVYIGAGANKAKISSSFSEEEIREATVILRQARTPSQTERRD
jgi:hypothetical protein